MEFGYVYLKKDGKQYMTKETNEYLNYMNNKTEKRRQEELYWKNLNRLVEYKIRECEENYMSYDIDDIYEYFMYNDEDEYYEENRKTTNYQYNSESDYYSD